MISDELSVFYDTDDFAVSVVRRRASVPDIGFAGISDAAAAETMQGYALAVQRVLRFPVADVREGDTLVFDVDGAPVVHRVLTADPVNDGAEMVAYLAVDG